MKKNIPIKNRYKIKKQWGEILPNLMVPAEVPLDFTKNFKIILADGTEKVMNGRKEFEDYLNKIIEDGKEIETLMVELNYEKLIVNVEKKFSILLKE